MATQQLGLESTLSQQELESRLWAAANSLRGPVDPADFKAYIFPLLFFKRIMDELRDTGAGSLLAKLEVDAPVYVSIDIDVLDMALVPGCVSAEPDGLGYRELRDMLVAIAEHTQVVGFDLVEVNPLLDVGTGITSYLGAHTAVAFLGHICAQARWIERGHERAEQRERSARVSK